MFPCCPVFRGWRRRTVCCYKLTTQTVTVSTRCSLTWLNMWFVRFITVFIYILIDNTTQTHHSQSKTSSLLLASAIVNGNTSCSTANSKASPESSWSWSEDRCNGHAPGRFSSPASGLSGFSSSVMSATSESALSTQSGYSSGRDGKSTNIAYIYTLYTVYTWQLTTWQDGNQPATCIKIHSGLQGVKHH